MNLKPSTPALLNPFTTKYVPACIEEVESTPAANVAEKTAETPAISIKAAVARFTNECARLVAEDYKRFTSLVEAGYSRTVLVEFGRRYAKLISMDVRNGETSAHSVYCFVDMTNGDILKAATWKAPAKHARGNVLSDERMNAVTAYGAVYIAK